MFSVGAIRPTYNVLFCVLNEPTPPISCRNSLYYALRSIMKACHVLYPQHLHILVSSKTINCSLHFIMFIRDTMPHGTLSSLSTHAFGEIKTKVGVPVTWSNRLSRIALDIHLEPSSHSSTNNKHGSHANLPSEHTLFYSNLSPNPSNDCAKYCMCHLPVAFLSSILQVYHDRP